MKSLASNIAIANWKCNVDQVFLLYVTFSSDTTMLLAITNYCKGKVISFTHTIIISLSDAPENKIKPFLTMAIARFVIVHKQYTLYIEHVHFASLPCSDSYYTPNAEN